MLTAPGRHRQSESGKARLACQITPTTVLARSDRLLAKLRIAR
jgi:hypothetical protein